MTSMHLLRPSANPPVETDDEREPWRCAAPSESLVSATIRDIASTEGLPPADVGPAWIPVQFLWSQIPPRAAEPGTISAEEPDLEPSLADLVHSTLSRTGYPLHRIRCWLDQDALVLTGVTTKYYYVQIALAAAMRHAGHRRIDNRIEVIPPASPSEGR